jgi:hypothetical protein
VRTICTHPTIEQINQFRDLPPTTLNLVAEDDGEKILVKSIPGLKALLIAWPSHKVK